MVERGTELFRDRKSYYGVESDNIKRLGGKDMGKSKKKKFTEDIGFYKVKMTNEVKEKNKLNKISKDLNIDTEDPEKKCNYPAIEESENEVGDGEDSQVSNIMDIEEVIGATSSDKAVSNKNVDERQHMCVLHDKVNRDRMILVNRMMKYEGEDKVKIT